MVLREELVDVGVRLVEERGLAALSLRRIAAEAGVSHGAPRHHFPTYGALLAAIARRGVEHLDAQLTEAFTDDDPRQAVARAAVVYVDFAMTRPEMFELLFRHDLLDGQGGHLRELTAPWFARLARHVAEASDDADPHLAAAVWSGVHGVAVLHARRATEPVGEGTLSAKATLERLLAGLLPEGRDPQHGA